MSVPPSGDRGTGTGERAERASPGASVRIGVRRCGGRKRSPVPPRTCLFHRGTWAYLVCLLFSSFSLEKRRNGGNGIGNAWNQGRFAFPLGGNGGRNGEERGRSALGSGPLDTPAPPSSHARTRPRAGGPSVHNPTRTRTFAGSTEKPAGSRDAGWTIRSSRAAIRVPGASGPLFSGRAIRADRTHRPTRLLGPRPTPSGSEKTRRDNRRDLHGDLSHHGRPRSQFPSRLTNHP
jgi:hypothetical protein